MSPRRGRRTRSRTAGIAAAVSVAALTGGLVMAVSTNANAAVGCRVDYTVTNQWQGGFGAEVTVTNLGDLVSGWSLAWVFPAGQPVTQAWNATVTTGTGNVIIRNLTIRDTRVASDDPDDKEFDYDGIQLDTADRVWIDHNRILRMNDGLLDSRKDTTNVTVSWNVLAEGNKSFGIGWTDNTTARLTIHHNWIHDTNSRNPSTDNVAYAHLYNNHLQDVRGYGNYSRGNTRMVLENSYFDNVRDPYYKDATAELRQSGSIVVDSTGKQQTGGSAFTPSDFYAYSLDKAADVPALLRAYAGPQADIGN